MVLKNGPPEYPYLDQAAGLAGAPRVPRLQERRPVSSGKLSFAPSASGTNFFALRLMLFGVDTKSEGKSLRNLLRSLWR